MLLYIKETNKTAGPCENQSFVEKRPFCLRVSKIVIVRIKMRIRELEKSRIRASWWE